MPKSGFALGVAGLELGQEDAGQFAHAGGVAEVVLHEDFHRAPAALIGVAHAGGDVGLHVEGQRVGGAPRGEVEVAAHGPEEILGPGEGGVFLGGEEARGDQPFGGGDAVEILADPVEGLQVAQAALALFHVGFEDVALPALALVPFGPFGEFRLDEFGPVVRKSSSQSRSASSVARGA